MPANALPQIYDDDIDNRGVVSKEKADQIRDLRSAEQWERIDSVVIGPGASNKARGWFNTWQDFANADELQWFSGRDSSVGPAYSNQKTERTDWAQDFYQSLIEFISPVGLADHVTDANDAKLAPLLFAHELPRLLSTQIVLSDSDQIANAPANHFPSGFGVANPFMDGSAAPSTITGSQGSPVVSNGWKWPSPVMLAAKAKLTVIGRIDSPIREALRAMPGPGFMRIPLGNGLYHDMPMYYVIKITHRGPRYLQIRGARSSA